MSVYVSLGRNIGDTPMSDEDWRSFRAEVDQAVSQYMGPVVSFTKGDGWYAGKHEETAIIVGQQAGENIDNREKFESRLSELARRYQQESVFVTYGYGWEVCADEESTDWEAR